MKLHCLGTGRDKDNEKSLCFYFNRRPSDFEMRFLDVVLQRAAVCCPVRDPDSGHDVTPRLKVVEAIADWQTIDRAEGGLEGMERMAKRIIAPEEPNHD
jgi:hypothetical protein